MQTENKVQDKLTRVSEEPGVYLMKDAAGEILYIGKATSLRDRVRSYFAADLAEGNMWLTVNIRSFFIRFIEQTIVRVAVPPAQTFGGEDEG